MTMKRTVLLVVAAALMVVIGIGGYAYSQNSAPAAKTCASQCPKFVDNNHDGVCDLSPQCHKDGKCVCGGTGNGCPNMKSGQTNGKCDHMSKCPQMQQQKTSASCPGKANNQCSPSCKAICGH
jgi:hypothetical protein